MSPIPAVTEVAIASWEGCRCITSCHQFLNRQQAWLQGAPPPTQYFLPDHTGAMRWWHLGLDGRRTDYRALSSTRGENSANTLLHCFFLLTNLNSYFEGSLKCDGFPIIFCWLKLFGRNCDGKNTKEGKSRAGASQVVQHSVANLPFIINSAPQKNDSSHTSFSADWVEASRTVHNVYIVQ